MTMANQSPELIERLHKLDHWLEEQAVYVRHDQRHLEQNTPEQAYWHLGYRAALRDVLAATNCSIDNMDTSKPNTAHGPDE